MFHYRAAHDAKISPMNMKAKCWQVRDKGKLLLTLMKELEGTRTSPSRETCAQFDYQPTPARQRSRPLFSNQLHSHLRLRMREDRLSAKTQFSTCSPSTSRAQSASCCAESALNTLQRRVSPRTVQASYSLHRQET
jgi:hypothetical protein